MLLDSGIRGANPAGSNHRRDLRSIQNRRFETLPRVHRCSAVSQFSYGASKPRLRKACCRGQVEITGRRPVAMQRPEPADAQARTVRHLTMSSR
jgi:hypothetical protein